MNHRTIHKKPLSTLHLKAWKRHEEIKSLHIINDASRDSRKLHCAPKPVRFQLIYVQIKHDRCRAFPTAHNTHFDKRSSADKPMDFKNDLFALVVELCLHCERRAVVFRTTNFFPHRQISAERLIAVVMQSTQKSLRLTRARALANYKFHILIADDLTSSRFNNPSQPSARFTG